MTYWSSTVGPYVWHEYDALRVAADLHDMASAGVRNVRTHLLWDAFMPTAERVADGRLRDFEHFCATAERESLNVTPVLFAQSLGDCVMLPPYAIDVSGVRPGVRVVSDAVVQPGGPRDQYAEPLMIEAALTWLDTMLQAFSGHPAITGWDFGHDPASTIRPRRIDDVRSWLSLLAGRVHEHGQTCALTLGVDDVLTARAMRPHMVSEAVDRVGLDADLDRIGPGLEDPPDIDGVRFLAWLTMNLAGGEPDLLVQVPPAARVAGFVTSVTDALREDGCAGVFAAAWSDCGERLRSVPPFDRHPRLAARGLVDISGGVTDAGAEWLQHIKVERERARPAPRRQDIDIANYYANLPGSVRELFTAWRDEEVDRPDMLS